MPAVTVEDILSLPRLPKVSSNLLARKVASITTAPAGLEGEGFPVRRAFAGISTRTLDPFIHMDQMGEVEYAPGEPKGTPWHPHRGFETVTYMIDGSFAHRDSTGGGGLITNGDTQWMTAGDGILHIERPPEHLVASGGLFHGIQLWVNLPSADKRIPPRYQDIAAGKVTLLSSPDGGALVRLIAGTIDGHRGPGTTHTPITMVHATVSAGARLELPWEHELNSLVYVLSGTGTLGAEGAEVTSGQLAVLARPVRAERAREPSDATGGDSAELVVAQAHARQESRSPALELLILGGRPIGEPVAHYGPFVMNTPAELAEAFEDFKRGRMGVIPAEVTSAGTPAA